MIEPRQYLARASGVSCFGAARRLEELVHRRLGLEIFFSASGGDWERLRLRREGELLRELRKREELIPMLVWS